MIELSDKVPRDIAKQALTQASHKLPKNKSEAKVKYKIIERHE